MLQLRIPELSLQDGYYSLLVSPKVFPSGVFAYFKVKLIVQIGFSLLNYQPIEGMNIPEKKTILPISTKRKKKRVIPEHVSILFFF